MYQIKVCGMLRFTKDKDAQIIRKTIPVGLLPGEPSEPPPPSKAPSHFEDSGTSPHPYRGFKGPSQNKCWKFRFEQLTLNLFVFFCTFRFV